MNILDLPNEIIALIISYCGGNIRSLSAINMQFRRKFAQCLFDLLRVDQYAQIEYFTTKYHILVRNVTYVDPNDKGSIHDYEDMHLFCDDFHELKNAKNLRKLVILPVIGRIDCGELPNSIEYIDYASHCLINIDKLPNLKYVFAEDIFRELPTSLESIECFGKIEKPNFQNLRNLRKLNAPNTKLDEDLSHLNITELKLKIVRRNFEYLPRSCKILKIKINSEIDVPITMENLPPNLEFLQIISDAESIYVKDLPRSLATLDISLCKEPNIQFAQAIELPNLETIFANTDSYHNITYLNSLKFPNVKAIYLVSEANTIVISNKNNFIQNCISAE